MSRACSRERPMPARQANEQRPNSKNWPSRRSLLESASVATLLLTTGMAARAQQASVLAAAPAAAPAGATLNFSLHVNGRDFALDLDPRTTLLDALREHLRPHRHEEGLRPRPVRRLHGAGQRPADQRLPDARRHARGRRDHDDRRPRRPMDDLHPMQAAFVEHDGFQCGYCTPGQICSAVGMLAEVRGGLAESRQQRRGRDQHRCSPMPRSASG